MRHMLKITSFSDTRLWQCMENHYTKPKGFVARQIHYAIEVDSVYYGHISAGSATRYLPGREFWPGDADLNQIVNNIFFHIEKVECKYPLRNFGQKILAEFRQRCQEDWRHKYGDDVVGFESLVALPRTGEIYQRDKWTEIGLTKGFTCKRGSGVGTDSWGGQRVWSMGTQKRVFAKYADGKSLLCWK